MLGRRSKWFFGFLFLLLPGFVSAQVSKIVFTTEPQTVKTGEVSGTLTIQLQDVAGNSAQATETIDVEFVSTSASGEFISPSTDNPVTKTISTGSANKNFRYRDSTEGIFIITVNAKGRVSGTSWSASQNINTSNTAVTSTSTATSSDEDLVATSTTSTSSSSSPSSQSSQTVSVHYSSSVLSTKKSEVVTTLSAGRDRLASVGSPLEFKAETNISYLRNSSFKWNFGDGNEGYGESVTHAYEYPGEYVVILNAVLPEGKTVSRSNIKIIDPELTVITASRERIEIKNNSRYEVNLFGRALTANGNTFVFPQDTLIQSGQSISFSSQVTKLYPESSVQVYIMAIGEVEPAKLIKKIEEKKSEEILAIKNKISDLQVQLATTSYIPQVYRPVPGPVTALNTVAEGVTIESQAANVLEAVAGPSNGKWSRWMQTLKSFFTPNKR